MKNVSKSASALLTLLAVSTLGGSVAFAADDATTLTNSGEVTVKEATNTEDDDNKGKTEDPEQKGDKGNPDEVVINEEKGPIKIERLTNLKFGEIQAKAGDITAYAKPTTFKTNSDGSALSTSQERGALVQFADVRSEKYGYTIQAKLSEQFKSGDNTLNGASITYKNAILKAATGNNNVAPTNFSSTFKLEENKDAVTILTAQEANKEGKGRYVLEYGQSASYDENAEGAAKGGTADTAKNSVVLNVPTNTASNMANGIYTAKITWTVVTGL